MAIVKAPKRTTKKFTVPVELAEQMKEYSKWSDAKYNEIIETALKRLFEQDEEWRVWLEYLELSKENK